MGQADNSGFVSGSKNGFILAALSLIITVARVDSRASDLTGNATSIPIGFSSLEFVDTPASDSSLSSTLSIAESFRTLWGSVEGTQGAFDWTFLDSETGRATQANKDIILRVISGGVNVPSWVFGLGVQTFSYLDTNPYSPNYGQQLTMAVPWDPTMLQYKKDLIRAIGVKYASNPFVKVVGASAANSSSDDWSLPHSPTDISNWRKAGYTAQKMIDACEQIIDETMADFPNQAVVMAFNTNGGLDQLNKNAKPNYVQSRVIAYARTKYGRRFIAQFNTLSATTPTAQNVPAENILSTIQAGGRPISGQMLWYVTGDPTCRMARSSPCDSVETLRTAVITGLGYNTRYQEIYCLDLLNPQLQPMLTKWVDRFK